MPLDIIQKQELAAQRGARENTSFSVDQVRGISAILGSLNTAPTGLQGVYGYENIPGIQAAAKAVKADVDHFLARYEANPQETGKAYTLNGHVCKFVHAVSDYAGYTQRAQVAEIKAHAYTPAEKEGTPSAGEMAQLITKIVKL